MARIGGNATATSQPNSHEGEGESESLGGHLRESAKLFEQPLLGIIGAIALLFGFIGYRQYFRSVGEPSGWVDVLYADMQLIKLSSKVTKGSAPWTLDVGRMLAPIVTGYAAFRGVAALHRERLDRIRVQRWRGHVVVVGATSAAVAVAKALRRQNRRVVLIDADLSSERATSLRSVGVFALRADPARPEILRQASVKGATDVLALTADDALNIDVALRSRGRARAMASVSRPDLCELLRIEALGATGSARLDFLNAEELCARTIDRSFNGGLVGGEGDLLITTSAVLASQLLSRAARQASTGSRRVHVTGPEGAAGIVMAERRDPHLKDHLTLSADGNLLDPPQIGEAIELTRVKRAVVEGEGTEAVVLALALARRLPIGAEVVLAIPDPEHLAPLLHSGAATRTVPIHIVDSISWWSDSDLVLGGTVEVIARATHRNYVETRRASGGASPDDPSLAEWAKLGTHLKDSNRKQARHLWVKLAAINCSLAPASGATAGFAFTDAEVELLAQLEHVRWVEERRTDGWRTGPRDVIAKRTPYLVDWSELTEAIRDLDRITVTQLPAFLNDVGYEIIRNEATVRST